MKRFRRYLSNIAVFLISFLLAILIWILASQANDPVLFQSMELPIDFVGQPEDSTLELTNDSIVIVVEAPTSVLSSLTSDSFSAVVDLSQAPLSEEVSLPITVNTKVPGVAVNPPSPEHVEVRLDKLISREIPVVLNIRGSVARGHTQGTPLIDPEIITVVGTAEQVNPLNTARATVFLDNTRHTFSASPFLVFYDRTGQIASINGLDSVSNESVSVTIPVEESADFAEKIIDVEWEGSPADGYRLLGISVDPPSALLQGLPTRLNALTQITTEPIDITGLTETFSQPIALDLPDGITLDEVQVYNVTVEIEPILSTAVYNRPIEFQGVEEGVTAAADPEEARVVLFGPLPILDSLTEDEVHVTVDAFGLMTGTYSLEPVVTFPDRGLELRSVSPPLIIVELTPDITPSLAVTTTQTTTATSPVYEGIVTAAAQTNTSSVDHAVCPFLHPAARRLHLSFLFERNKL
ncbi:MAG: hypothetical protein CSA11_03020 [Chloroflexi bacterium]|nr:MAG: hypothetical protein CSA11_03020 [Chloroflexota bacterium]